MKPKKNDAVISKIISQLKPIGKWLALGALLDVFAVLLSVTAPELMGNSVQVLYDYWKMGAIGSVLPSLIRPLSHLFIVYCIHGLLSYLNMQLMNRVVSRHYSCGLRIMLSDKIKRLPVSYVDQTPVGDILQRMTGDVSEMGGYVHQIFDTLIRGVFQLLLIAVAMLMEDWRLGLFVICLTPVSLLLSSWIAGISEKHYEKMFENSGKLTELVEESFSNYPTTKSYNLEDMLSGKHSQVNQELYNTTVKANFTGGIVQPLIRLSNAIAYILINLVGGYLIVFEGVSVGVIVTIVLYAAQFASPLEQLAYGFSQINRVKAASRRVFSILDMEEEERIAENEINKPAGDVEFRNVSFRYKEDEPLIEKLNICVRPGQNVAIVGPTGAGKTTIVNLLMRFYDPDSGKIFLDGMDTRSCTRENVRENIGMVLQDTWLFRGTIAQNVAYGNPNSTMDQIRQACIEARCDHFIRTLPKGYETVVGEDNNILSGGQKQLLTIARAILADKPILILDEATSNVDTRTEILIQNAMDTLMKGKTSFVIAHRLSTIVNADLILVLDHGRIVEQGTHQELLDQKGFYHKLYTSQYAI